MEALNVSKPVGAKSEDVDFVASVSLFQSSLQVKQVGCTRAEAEDALREGGLVKALMKLVKPKERAMSA